MNKLHHALALLALTVAPALACIDDPTALEEGEFPLSEAEIRLLGLDIYQEILDARESGLGVGATSAASVVGFPGVAEAPVGFNDRSEILRDCPGGGTLRLVLELKGVVNDESDAGWGRLRMVNDWIACAPEGPDAPVRDGAPYVQTELYLVSDGVEVELDGSVRGGVRVTTGDVSALCVVNLTLEGWERPDGSSYTATRGTVCGESFEEESTTAAGG